MLQDVDPVGDRERRCQWKQDDQLRRCDAEEKQISQSASKHVRHARARERIYLPDTLCGFERDSNCNGTCPGPCSGLQTLGFNRLAQMINPGKKIVTPCINRNLVSKTGQLREACTDRLRKLRIRLRS